MAFRICGHDKGLQAFVKFLRNLFDRPKMLGYEESWPPYLVGGTRWPSQRVVCGNA